MFDWPRRPRVRQVLCIGTVIFTFRVPVVECAQFYAGESVGWVCCHELTLRTTASNDSAIRGEAIAWNSQKESCSWCSGIPVVIDVWLVFCHCAGRARRKECYLCRLCRQESECNPRSPKTAPVSALGTRGRFRLEEDERGLRSLRNFLEHLGLEQAVKGLDLPRDWREIGVGYFVRKQPEHTMGRLALGEGL